MYREDSVMGKIRMMNIGDTMFFPLNDWNKCRTAAYYLKADFGAMYRVRKCGDQISVVRVEPGLYGCNPLSPGNLLKLGFVRSKTHGSSYVFSDKKNYFRYYINTGRMVFRCGSQPAQFGTVVIHQVYELQNLSDMLKSGISFKI